MLLKNIVTISILVPTISIIFAYTKANIYSFWLGFLICIITEFVICLIYCFSKLQKAYRDSSTIKLTQNHQMDFQRDYPPPKSDEAKDIYLNRFTDEARLTTKKNSFQSPQLQQQIQQVQIDRVPYKQKIQTYIEQIRNQYECLNKFNQALIDYGNRMILLPRHSLMHTEHRFIKNQICYVNENFSSQFQSEERRALFTELKISLKKVKKATDNVNQNVQNQKNLQNIVLPTWRMITKSFSNLGKQFKMIETIKECNSAVLEMVHKKIEDDYEILQKEISHSVANIAQLKENIQNLRKEHQKLQKYETSGHENDNIEIIYWLKKQYFEFTNIVLRIKQNEKQYKLQTQKLAYYKAKLNTFYQSQYIKYEKIIHTRCYAFLDAYRITLQESLNELRNSFQDEGYNYNEEDRPPKVKEPAKSKNMNELVSIQKNYQQQYFQRVQYYINKIQNLYQNLEDLQIFLSKFRGIFSQLINHLVLDKRFTSVVNSDKESRDSQQKKALLLDSLFKTLSQQSARIVKILRHLENVNKEVRDQNHKPLLDTADRIRLLCFKAQKITISLDQTEGPLREKYRVARQELNHVYRQIEELINGVKQFEGMAACHGNRIKKILISSLTTFLTQQRKWVMYYLYNDATLKKVLNQSDMEELNNYLQTTNQNKMQQVQQLTLQKLNNLETGVLFAEEYRLLLNRFFFVAYTEWSQSQLFRYTISKEIYIALNEDISEYFTQIIVEDFQSTGLPPQVVWLKELRSQQGEFIVDLNVAFRGRIVIKISTKIVAFLTISVQFQIAIEQFYAILRLCFIHNEMGCSWFSFVGEPMAKIIVRPKIGNLPINMANVTGMLQSSILAKLKKFIYPIKKKISIPLYKKDDSYEVIQKRFESMGV